MVLNKLLHGAIQLLPWLPPYLLLHICLNHLICVLADRRSSNCTVIFDEYDDTA